MTMNFKNGKSSVASKADSKAVQDLLSNVMKDTVLTELPFHVETWIVDAEFYIAGITGNPFDDSSASSLLDAYSSKSVCELMIDKHNDALLTGSSAFSTVIGNKQKFICLTRVFYLEKIAYIVGYSIDSSDLRDIYNQLLSIREKTYSLQSNEKIRVSVDAILNSNIFKMFIKTAGG